VAFGDSVNFSFLNSQFRCDLGHDAQKPFTSDMNLDIQLRCAEIFSNIHISCVLTENPASLMMKCVAGRTAPLVPPQTNSTCGVCTSGKIG